MPAKLNIAFIADPLPHFDPVAETTFFLMHEVCRRGWGCYHVEQKDLFVLNRAPHALAKKITVSKKAGIFSYNIQTAQKINLNRMHAVFLRKDPPVDMNFVDHLSILQLLTGKTLLINPPTALKLVGEKLYTLHFNDLVPPTLVSRNNALLLDFVGRQNTAVLKPLNNAGGREVVLVKHADKSARSLIDILTQHETRFVMAQKYIKEANKGDKRILLLDGKILGSFIRVPSRTDFRGNLHSGARLSKCRLTPRDHEIVRRVAPALTELGLVFVGLDILGSYLTEINCTSVMGIREINKLENTCSEKTVVDWLQKQLIQ